MNPVDDPRGNRFEDLNAADQLQDQIDQIVAQADLGSPDAAARGRNPRWPYVPIVRHSDGTGPRARQTEQIVLRAFATRAEAVEDAARVIALRRASLARQLADPRHRAVREQYGLPRDIPS